MLQKLHSMLEQFQKQYKHGVTIIGQNLVMDLIWTDLRKGKHYQRTIDIAHLFRTKSTPWGPFTYFGLRHVCWALLNRTMNERYHDPSEDAHVTMQLYRDFCLNEEKLGEAKKTLSRLKKSKGFPNFTTVSEWAQCSAIYTPSKCKCNQENATDIKGCEDIEKLRNLYRRSRPTWMLDGESVGNWR